MRTIVLVLMLIAAPLVLAAPAAALPTLAPERTLDAADAWANCVLASGTDNLALPCGAP